MPSDPATRVPQPQRPSPISIWRRGTAIAFDGLLSGLPGREGESPASRVAKPKARQPMGSETLISDCSSRSLDAASQGRRRMHGTRMARGSYLLWDEDKPLVDWGASGRGSAG